MRALLGIAVAGALLAACGDAPSYHLTAFAFDVAPRRDAAFQRCLEGGDCAGGVESVEVPCDVAWPLALTCPFFDFVVVDDVALAPPAIVFRGHGCMTDGWFCDEFSAEARFEPDGSFQGRGELAAFGYRFVLRGGPGAG